MQVATLPALASCNVPLCLTNVLPKPVGSKAKTFFFHWEKPSALCCKKCHQILNANVFSSSNVHSHFSFIIVSSRLSPGSLEQSLPASVTTKHTLRLNNTENALEWSLSRRMSKISDLVIKLHDKVLQLDHSLSLVCSACFTFLSSAKPG